MSSSESGTSWPNCACASLADWQAAGMLSISIVCAASACTWLPDVHPTCNTLLPARLCQANPSL